MDEDGASALHRAVQSRIGTALRGKYLLEQLLGVGGMAAVYRATNTTVRRPCAVKVLHEEISGIRDLRERFLREGRVANAVGHAGAVDILDCDVTEDGAAFLVMELLEGECVDTLRDASRRIGLGVVLAIAHELLGVLVAAHAKGVVHRDLKPANLFMTREGRLKVLDFGIARIRDTGSGFDVTRSGVSMGTPAFMSPEQALGRTDEVGPRSDLWAVGATMFSLLTGRNVHEAETAQEMMILVATTPIASLGHIAPDIPAPVVAVVDRALAFDRDARWPDAASMRAAVAAATPTSADVSTPGLVAQPASPAMDLASTLVAVAAMAPAATVASAVAVAASSSEVAVASDGMRRVGVGATTLQPISSGPVVPMARMAPRPLVIGIVLAALVAGGVAIWLTGFRTTQVVAAAPMASTVAPVATSAPVAQTPSAARGPEPHGSGSAGIPSAGIPSATPASATTVRNLRRTPPTKPPESAPPPPPPRPPPTRDPLEP